MNDNGKPAFRILPDAEFRALTTNQRVEYLKQAIAARNDINRQIEWQIEHLPRDKGR